MKNEQAALSTTGSGPAQPAWEALLTADEAGDRLRVHPKTVVRMARNHALPSLRIGKLWRFRESDLARWADSQVQSSGQPIGRPEA